MKDAIRLAVVGVAALSILLACAALFYVYRAEFEMGYMRALSDEYEAPRELAGLVERHRTDSLIPMHAITVRHLGELIARQNRRSFIQNCVIGGLSILCITLGTLILRASLATRKEPAQPGGGTLRR